MLSVRAHTTVQHHSSQGAGPWQVWWRLSLGPGLASEGHRV